VLSRPPPRDDTRARSSGSPDRVGAVLEVGDRIPAVTVFRNPGEALRLDELVGDGAVLLLFYLFDWSST
jgi:hypothetical protein